MVALAPARFEEDDPFPPGGPQEERPPTELFGWQSGADGFCSVGMGAPYFPGRPWENMLYQGLFAGQDSGKTFAGCARHLMYLAAWPGSVNIIAAPDFTRLDRATFQKWKEFLADNGLIEGVHWIYNVTLKKLNYWNGSVDYLCSMDNPASVRGVRAASIWLDEAGYCDWASMKSLQPRMTRPGFPHFFDMTSTPVGKAHWSYGFFFPRRALEEGYTQMDLGGLLLEESGDPATDRTCVTRTQGTPEVPPSTRICTFAETRENPHEGMEEWAQLITLFGEGTPEFEQEARGRFIAPGGVTYTAWRTADHALPRRLWPDPVTRNPRWKPDRVAMGGDFGVDHKAAWVVWGIGLDGREYVLETWSKRGSDPYEMADEGERLALAWGVKHVYTDHDPTWFRPIKAKLNERDISVFRANKFVGRATDPSGGIGLINSVLRKRFPDGSAGLIVDRDTCSGLVREFENYHRPTDGENPNKPTSERPVHVGDDELDAGRYVRTAISLRLHWDQNQAPAGMRVVKADLGRAILAP